jgi:hypothetical protein
MTRSNKLGPFVRPKLSLFAIAGKSCRLVPHINPDDFFGNSEYKAGNQNPSWKRGISTSAERATGNKTEFVATTDYDTLDSSLET